MQGQFDTPEARWAGVGPYYAMFPASFADRVVSEWTDKGDWVLDPFAGRGTTVFSAASAGRHAVGIEINPVGWLYGATKLSVADPHAVERRLQDIDAESWRWSAAAHGLPPFFHACFERHVLSFLVCARNRLDWRRSKVDRTLMAFILIYLHGKREAALSNQMRQTKAMAPRYALHWWRERSLRPPAVDPVEFLWSRIEWRYSRGSPNLATSHMVLGDCTQAHHGIRERRRAGVMRPARLLLTSPPYFDVTNYHYDQWLRLWMLGGAPNACRAGGKYKGKFENRISYQELLLRAFRKSSELLAKDATVYVRTGRQTITRETTVTALRTAFPRHTMSSSARPFTRPTQTRLFGDHTQKVGEMDLVLTPAT